MNIYPQGSLEFRNISYKWRISHSYNKYKYNTQIQAHKHIHTYTHAHRQQTRFYSSIWPNISSFWDVFYHIISLFIKITYLLLLLPRPYFFTFVRGVVTHVECSASLGLFNLSLYRKVYNMFILSILWIGANTGVSVQVGPALYHLFLKNLERNYNVLTIFYEAHKVKRKSPPPKIISCINPCLLTWCCLTFTQSPINVYTRMWSPFYPDYRPPQLCHKIERQKVGLELGFQRTNSSCIPWFTCELVLKGTIIILHL